MKKILFVLALIILLLSGWLVFRHGNPPTSPKSPDEPKLEAAINGRLVDPLKATSRPIAVMIENHPDSRPQSGLESADLVYETLAEGGITRFEVIYQTINALNIGPVRSVREYFAEIASENGAALAHVGGSDQALSKLQKNAYSNVSDIDEYYNAPYFQRPKTKFAPHNVYTSVENLRRWLDDKNASKTAKYELWAFKDDAASVLPKTAATVTINFSTASYKVAYEYYAPANSYKRFMAGKQHLAETKQEILAKNIIVQFVDTTAIPNDPKLRIEVDLHGKGKAIVFLDGVAIEGTWTKTGNSRTRYYYSSGAEIALNRGQTWIELVPSDNPLGRLKWLPEATN